jgi:predicted nucleic acid-binding protein
MNVDEIINLCDSQCVIFDTSVIINYIRILLRKNYERKRNVLSRIFNQCSRRAITTLIYEEILAGSKEDVQLQQFLSDFMILPFDIDEAIFASRLEKQIRNKGLKPKGENWRIDLFISAFAYTQRRYILTKDEDFTKMLNCEKLDEVKCYVCRS